MEPHAIIQELARLERIVLDERNRLPVTLDAKWAASAPAGPGVYAWFDGEHLIYVGESGSLCERCGDARRTMNHTLRRAIGRAKYSQTPGYMPASSKANFPSHIEDLLNAYMKSLHVAWVEVAFGRTEFEEHLVKKYQPIYNTRSQRGHRLAT